MPAVETGRGTEAKSRAEIRLVGIQRGRANIEKGPDSMSRLCRRDWGCVERTKEEGTREIKVAKGVTQGVANEPV